MDNHDTLKLDHTRIILQPQTGFSSCPSLQGYTSHILNFQRNLTDILTCFGLLVACVDIGAEEKGFSPADPETRWKNDSPLPVLTTRIAQVDRNRRRYYGHQQGFGRVHINICCFHNRSPEMDRKHLFMIIWTVVC